MVLVSCLVVSTIVLLDMVVVVRGWGQGGSPPSRGQALRRRSERFIERWIPEEPLESDASKNGTSLARVLAEHDEAVAVWGVAAGEGVNRLLVLVEGRHGAATPAVLLRVVEDVHRLLPEVRGALGGGEDEGRAGVDRPVAVVDHSG